MKCKKCRYWDIAKNEDECDNGKRECLAIKNWDEDPHKLVELQSYEVGGAGLYTDPELLCYLFERDDQ